MRELSTEVEMLALLRMELKQLLPYVPKFGKFCLMTIKS